ncbi:MAG: ABC transporter substrate-binding protein [Spirochaetales bacterium]|uniref:ABC transporter substrate-binding protein n=1 Tax=Candidatus Thalassospirochaeta sargassi TaxID=3119039 RepID=A0AAJ1MM10_9SPIO|nr:ABC transporter substrate-binding protein [Spirochaetales bacterium]
MNNPLRKILTTVLMLSIFAAFPASSDSGETPRIISWGRGYSLVLDMLYMFPEAEESIVAMGSGTQAGGYFQKLLDSDYRKKAVLEMDLQDETAASYNPTHIILKSYMRGAAEGLAKLDIPVMFIDMESPEQYESDLTRLGELFENPARAEELKTYFNSEKSEVVKLTGPLRDSEKPGVLFIYYSVKGGIASMRVPPADWIQTRMIEWAGGIPVWKDAVTSTGWQTVSFEQIAAWNPDTVFMVTYHSDIDEARNMIADDPLWRLTEAGQQDRIFGVPGDFMSWDQPSPRWILGLNWMGTKLQPQIFSEERLEEKIYDFYSTAYGFSRKKTADEIIPRITGSYR